jgi:hypothetical protein
VRRLIALALLALVAAAPQDGVRHGAEHEPARKAQLYKTRTHLPAPVARRSTPRQKGTPTPDYIAGFTAAPVPNQDLTAPPVPEDRQPHIAPTLFDIKNAYPGDGYVYGSSPQGMDDRKAATIPGIKLSVPLR